MNFEASLLLPKLPTTQIGGDFINNHFNFWLAMSTLTPILFFAYILEVRLVVGRSADDSRGKVIAGITTSGALVGLIIVLVWTLTSLSENRDDHRPQTASQIVVYSVVLLAANPFLTLLAVLVGRRVLGAFLYFSVSARSSRRLLGRLRRALDRNKRVLWRERAALHRSLHSIERLRVVREILLAAHAHGEVGDDVYREFADVVQRQPISELSSALGRLSDIRLDLDKVRDNATEVRGMMSDVKEGTRALTEAQWLEAEKLLQAENARRLHLE